MLLSVSHVSKGFGPSLVLGDVSFIVNKGDRLALVGANGVGKTTLLRVLAREIEPDGGEIVVPAPIDLGYLPQVVQTAPGQTIERLLRASLGRLDELADRLRVLETQLSHGGAETEAALPAYADVTEQFERLGGYDLDHRIDAVLGGLGIAHLSRTRAVASLSGGEKARLALAALLLRAPDLLLLDEPTNHLDFRALEWLESYLRSYRGAYLVVSHDRQFLNRTATAILEIDEHLRDAQLFPGDYDAYLAAKAKERAQWREAYAKEQEEIKALREAIRGAARRVGHHNRPPPDNDKYAKTFFGENVQRAVSRNVRASQEKLRRIEQNPMLKPPDALRIRTDFDPEELAGKMPLAAEAVCKAFAGRKVLDEACLALGPESRIVITGPNGAGKTTLLRILAGLETPDAGNVYHAPSVRLGYLDQEQEELDPSQRAFDAYCAGVEGDRDALRADLFRHGFFRYEDVEKRVGELSVGQRRKLQIARLVARRANVLLLDEPTNHVDLPTLEAFEAALLGFPGAILAISHDRWFIERMVAGGGEVHELVEGNLRPSPRWERSAAAIASHVA